MGIDTCFELLVQLLDRVGCTHESSLIGRISIESTNFENLGDSSNLDLHPHISTLNPT
ncbi:hypothetical protein ACQZV8_18025 [Magnetococcales bacterium HHB-1]